MIVSAKLAHLFSCVAAAHTIVDFDRRDIELVAIADGFDMRNPYGRSMAQMASVFAELARAMIRERTRMVESNRSRLLRLHADLGQFVQVSRLWRSRELFRPI